MASDDDVEPDAPEPEEGEQGNASEEESEEGEPSDDELSPEEVEQLKADNETLTEERDRYKRDYAGLKKDYDKNATKAKKAPKSPEDPTVDWKILNASRIQTAGEAYKEEMEFLKSHGVPITEEVLERALGNAEARKGLKKPSEVDKTVTTEPPSEIRKGKAKLKPPASFIGTQEQFEAIVAQKEAEKKALGKK